MSRRPRPLQFEQLEDRTLPSASVWGTPWPDGQHLTVSFAPNGTSIAGMSNTLSEVLAQSGSNAEISVLAGLQTWADYADLNFGLVSDGGEAFGIGKAIQNDPRFGDIRVGAVPLASDLVAITSPFDYFDTNSGDVILNSSQPIGSTYNLNTVALHEMGHALGLADNTDPTSVMYESYLGTNNTLSAADIAAIQALYGPRPANATNDSFATALTYSSPVYAQLNSATDADYYKFTTPLLSSGTTIHLQAEGLSLLDATVSVYSSNGKLVTTATATNPTSNDITLNLNGNLLPTSYYVVVNSPNGGVFDVGSYDLTITSNSVVGDLLGGVVGLLGNVGHTLTSATGLVANTLGLDGEVNYNARASLSTGTQTDFYAVQAPASASGSENMVASVWTLTNQSLTPRVQVFDSLGNPVAFQVLTDTVGASTIQVLNATPGAQYELEITSATQQTGNYSLSVSYLSNPIVFPLTASGTLTSSAASASATLTIDQSQMMHFVIQAGTSSDANTLLLMTITDANGNTVATIETPAGTGASDDVFLAVGSYTVTITAETTDGSELPPLAFTAGAIGTSNPVTTAAQNPSMGTSNSSSNVYTTSPPTSPPTTTGSTSSWSGSSPSNGVKFN